jgi:hypothetical protein
MDRFFERLAEGVFDFLLRLGFWKSLVFVVVVIFAVFAAWRIFHP